MARSTTVRITGAKEVLRELEKYAARFDAKGVTPALMDGARIIRDQAKQNAPERTGLLRSAIFAAPGKPDDSAPDVLVGVLAKKAPHAWWFEFGSSVVKPAGYLRKAIDSTRAAVFQAVAERLKRDLGPK